MRVQWPPARVAARRGLLTHARIIAWLLALACFPGAAAHAQRTDIVTLANGDRITGEVVQLDRGQLEFKTDDAGTLYLEWDKLISLTSLTREFEITTTDGRRFLGSLGPAAPRALNVVGRDTVTVIMSEATHIYVVGSSFWAKLDGALSTGFNYTKSSDVAQLNINADTTYRRPGFDVRLVGSYTATAQEDDSDPDDRGSIEGTYSRILSRRWILAGIGRLETNESLGLELRTEAGAAAGPRFVDTNRAQLWVGAGVMVNREKGVDVEPTKNIEAMVILRTSYFTYDRPKTTIDIGFQYFSSMTEPGRRRVQLDAALRRELLKDLIVTLNLYDSYDSRPPNEEFDTNDVGVVWSIGWTF